MVITLLYVLNHKEQVVGVLDNSAPLSCPYFNDKHVENIETGVHTYEFSVPASHQTAGKILTEGYIILTDLDRKQQMFKIKEVEEEANDSGYVKNVFCEHIAISELLVEIVRPVTITSSTLENALSVVLDGSGWELGKVDYTESLDVVFENHVTVLEALLKILELYRMEVQYEVLMKNGSVVSKKIHVQEKRGRITKKLFSYGKDLIGVKRTNNSDELITALIGIGKGDESGKSLTLQNFAWEDGDFYTETATDYVTNNTLLQRWGKDGKHKFGVYYSDKDTQVGLFYDTVEELKRRSTPVSKYECSVATLERITGYAAEKVRIGDTISVKDETFNPVLALEARVIELVRSYTAPENDSVVLGDYKPIKLTDVSSLKAIQKKLQQKEKQWEQTAYKVDIISSKGLIFRNNTINTILYAKVYRGGIDITDELDENRFRWTRISEDAAADMIWNNEHASGKKYIEITHLDVQARATFNCEVMV